DVRVLEYSGVNTLDQAIGASGSSATSSTGSVTTTAANELLFAANTVLTWTTGAGTSFSSRIITSPNGDIAEDRIVSAAGSYNATAALGSSGAWVMQLVTFRAGVVAPPSVSSVTPSSGPTTGGTAVTITGTNFATGATVSFGGTAATNVNVTSGTTLTATTPAHAAGNVAVVVTNPDAQSATLASGFTYAAPPPPSVSSITPDTGPATGGTSVTITGSNFVAGASVRIGGTLATNVTVTNGTSLTATTPAHAAGTVSVMVTNPDAQSGTLASAFTYTTPPPPSISGVSPGSGPAVGGTAVTITGTNFAAGATVSFGGTLATGVSVTNSTTLTATTPAHSAGTVSVVVTNADAQSATLANAFTYTAALPPSVSGITPLSGPTTGGTAVTISGSNFSTGATVSFGGTAATNVTVSSPTTITATTPAHTAGAVNVLVTNPDLQSSTLASGFTYTTPTAITFRQVNAAVPQTPQAVVS